MPPVNSNGRLKKDGNLVEVECDRSRNPSDSDFLDGRLRKKHRANNNDNNDNDDDEGHDGIWFPGVTKHINNEQKKALEETASKLGASGKGITACDESAGTIGARFESVGIENTEENRRLYRQMLFETEGSEKFLCGAILDPETLYQKSSNHGGKLFPEVLQMKGIVPGVKPHLKVCTLPGTNGDTVMQGLDSLAVRTRGYYKAGARFVKWRSPISIDLENGRPTALAIKANMDDLARYALICQSEGLMPIVEPDVSLQGRHTLDQAVAINITVLSTLFKALIDHGVHLPGCTLKSNIVNCGKDCSLSYSVKQIASANKFVLQQTLPVSIKSANYLSGGQTLKQAAARLAALNEINAGPWNLSFSWSAAIQLPLLELCKGHGCLQLDAMKSLYIEELEIASLAASGKWHPNLQPSDGDHRSA